MASTMPFRIARSGSASQGHPRTIMILLMARLCDMMHGSSIDASILTVLDSQSRPSSPSGNSRKLHPFSQEISSVKDQVSAIAQVCL
jgi:hypothetical protein